MPEKNPLEAPVLENMIQRMTILEKNVSDLAKLTQDSLETTERMMDARSEFDKIVINEEMKKAKNTVNGTKDKLITDLENKSESLVSKHISKIEKGAKGERGEKGDKGEDGLDGLDGKDATLEDVKGVAEPLLIEKISEHEEKNDHSLLHDPSQLGSLTLDETMKRDGRMAVVHGDKLVFRDVPKGGNGTLRGGGGSSGGGSGDVVGPSSATDNALARYDGTTGKLIQNGTITQDDNGNLQNVDAISFNTTPSTSMAEGVMAWNSTDATLDVGMPGGVVNLQLGQEILLRVTNKTGGDLTNGQIVYIDGAQGNRPTVALADADLVASHNTIGMLTEDIDNNDSGFVTTFGFVRDVDTSAYAAGTLLYLSQTAGEFTDTIPAKPVHAIVIGYVVSSGVTGIVLVKTSSGAAMGDLHDASITSVGDNEILQYNSGASIWENQTLAEAGISAVGHTHVESDITDYDPASTDMARISGSTYSTIQHLQDVFHSTGSSSGGTINDAGGGNITVDAGTGFIRATDSEVAQLLYFDWSALGSTAIPSDTTRYIGVEYNAGSPQVVVKTSYTWDFNTDFPLGNVVNEGGTLHIESAPHKVGDHANFMIQRAYETMPIQRDDRTGGLILGETGTRNVTLTAGALWERIQRFAISAIDTSVSGSFDTYYRDGIGGWTRVAAQTQWPNTQYDDGSGTLATMTNNRYANLWFYIELDGTMTMVYGQSEHTAEASAEAESPPSGLPDRIEVQSKLIGRIIFKKSDATATAIESVFTTTFSGSIVSDHGNLAGLSDDDHTQYALLAGRSGGQTLIGGTASGDDLTLQSTSNATKGSILFGTSAYDEVNNRLGIGTTSPDGSLHVMTASAGAVTANASLDDLVVENNTNGGVSVLTPNNVYGYYGFGDPDDSHVASIRYLHTDDSMNFYVNNADRVTIDSAGNVGIGTTSPGVASFAERTLTISDQGANTNPALELYSNTSSANTIGGIILFQSSSCSEGSDRLAEIAGLTGATVNDGVLRFYTTKSGTLSQAVDIDEDGQVGIGTTTPSQKLQVLGATDVSNSAETKNIRLNPSSTIPLIGTTTNHGFQIATNSAARMTFDTSGNVGIGTTNPAGILNTYKNNTDTTVSDIIIEQDGTGDAQLKFLLTGTKNYVMGIDNSDADSFKISNSGGFATDDFVIKTTGDAYFNNGNVGIGISTPAGLLDVDSNLVVNADTGVDITVPASNATGTYALDIQNNSSANTSQHGLRVYTEDTGGDPLKISHDNGTTTDLFVEKGTGYVGMGTADPDTICHIEGSEPVVTILNSDAANAANECKIDFILKSSTAERSFFSVEARSTTTTDASRESTVEFMTNEAGSNNIAAGFVGNHWWINNQGPTLAHPNKVATAGEADIASSTTTLAIAFKDKGGTSKSLADTNYTVNVDIGWQDDWWITNKAVTGFTVNLATGHSEHTDQPVHWSIALY